MSKLRIGFVGAGFIGQLAHIENFSQLDNCVLVALAEIRPELRQKVAEKYSIAETYEDHLEMLQHSDIDAVIVVTARPHTFQVVADCLNAKKHVFSEKPMAGSYLLAQQLVELARKNQRRYCVGYMKRYDDGIVHAKKVFNELIKSEELGALRHVRATCYMGDSYCKAKGDIKTIENRSPESANLAPGPEWLNKNYHAAFARYVNVYSHSANLLDFFLDEIPSVDYFNYISPKTHTCVLQYKNFLATIDTGDIPFREWQEAIEFMFDFGRLSIKVPPALLRNVPASVEIYKATDPQQVIQPKIEWSWAFRNQAQSFVSDIVNEKPSAIDAKYALEDFRLIEKIWQFKHG